LIKAIRDLGYEIKFNESHTNRQSKIRNYSTYRA
jgi:hypothetical protein